MAMDSAPYVGAEDGGIYQIGSDYVGDAGESITAYWESRNTDFSDQIENIGDLLKTIERVRLFYVDTNETDVTVSISTDDGLTWTDVTNTVGSGTSAPAEENFDFWVTGKEFRFKITHASADDNFQWVRLEATVVPQGPWFAVD